MDATAHFSAQHGALEPAAPWLAKTREAGLARLVQTGFPTRRDEAWKYTNASKLLATPWAPAAAGSVDALPERALADGPRLVWVDGRFSGALSSLRDLPEGVTLRPLTAKKEDPLLAEQLAPFVAEDAGFDALNAAFLTDGAVLRVADGADVSQPVHLVHLATGGERLNAVRIVIEGGKSSRATVVEHWLGEGSSLTTAVTQIHLAANAQLTHVRLNDEDPEGGMHSGTVVARQDRDSRLLSHVITLGGAMSRVGLRSELAGEGAEVAMNGLYLLRGKQHADHYTWIDHQVPHTDSSELYKGILDDRSRGVFTGRVVVQKDAQKINSAQANHNLVLSDTAVANTRPQLEIFADDVKCAHGATIGRIDPDASFYLQARGLSALEARSLLTFAFANEVLSHLPEGPVREGLEARVQSWLER